MINSNLKKFVSFALVFFIISFSLASSSVCVYAGSSGHFGENESKLFNKVYDGFDFSETIAKHQSFYFLDKAGKKHAVSRVGSSWICLFGDRMTFNGNQDTELNYYLSYYAYAGYSSLGDSFANLLSVKLGILTKGGSTLVEDFLSRNITTVANKMTYDDVADTVSFDSTSIDLLRKEIKKYYYNSIGIVEYQCRGTVLNLLDSSNFSGLFEYEEDKISALNAYHDYKYAFIDFSSSNSYSQSDHNIFWNDTDYVYLGSDLGYAGTESSGNRVYKLYSFSNDKAVNFIENKQIVNRYDVPDSKKNITALFTDPKGVHYTSIFTAHTDTKSLLTDNYHSSFYGIPVSKYDYTYFYSYNKEPFRYFKSYSAMYNYLHGDQTAYLTSQVQKTGEDISLSIKDMNENLSSKMDELIDNLNSNKSNMTRDELQDAIDKGVENISKNTDEIKENTSDIVNLLKEQNKILLDILGATEYIAYQKTKDDGSSYTKTDVINTINKIYNGFGNAILYGKNTLTDSGDSSAAAAQSYFVSREDFKLSNNIYTSSGSGVSPGTPVVAYSFDDSPVYDDSYDFDVGIATQDINNMDIHDGIFGKFPFSVPYQLYEWLQVLQADPVAPKLVYNYGFLLGHKNDQKYDLVIDFNIYEPWANVCKSFLRLSFTLLMAVFIFRHFSNNKGGGVL